SCSSCTPRSPQSSPTRRSSDLGGRESPVERAQLPPLPAREADRRQHARVPPHADTRQLRPTAAPLPAPGTESRCQRVWIKRGDRSEEHTSELQSRGHLVCRLLL